MESEHLNGSASRSRARRARGTHLALHRSGHGGRSRAGSSKRGMARLAVRRGVRIGGSTVGDERARSAHRRAGGPRSRRASNDCRRGRSDAPSVRRVVVVRERSGRPLTAARSWFESLAGEADRLLEHLEAEFGSRTPESLAEGSSKPQARRTSRSMRPSTLRPSSSSVASSRRPPSSPRACTAS